MRHEPGGIAAGMERAETVQLAQRVECSHERESHCNYNDAIRLDGHLGTGVARVLPVADTNIQKGVCNLCLRVRTS